MTHLNPETVSQLSHGAAHGAGFGSGLLGFLIALWALRQLVRLVRALLGAWAAPSSTPALSGETPEATRKRHTWERWTGIQIVAASSEELVRVRANLQRLRARNAGILATCLLLISFAWGPVWLATARGALDSLRNTIYLRTHEQPPAPPLGHAVDVSRSG